MIKAQNYSHRAALHYFENIMDDHSTCYKKNKTEEETAHNYNSHWGNSADMTETRMVEGDGLPQVDMWMRLN